MSNQAREASIVIPVYNKWELTRNCLKSLAATIDSGRVEVIVVDNASTDATPQACGFLGERLFGSSFHYIRNEMNRNFSGASNQGAAAASGEYLVFLNNDTVAQAGWYDPLLEDFANFSRLAGTGPILAYPEEGFGGRMIQHLGVVVNPFYYFYHLHQNIPLSSRLAGRRRFFQVITAACLVMPKSLFMESGQFDEGYVNGFEDVDLCARLHSRGYRFTVNPGCGIIHAEGQTPGRKSRDQENLAKVKSSTARFFTPDLPALLAEDDLKLTVNEWCNFQFRHPEELEAELNSRLPGMKKEELEESVLANIYWEDGWKKLLAQTEGQSEYLKFFRQFFKLFRTVPNAAWAIRAGVAHGDKELINIGKAILRAYADSPEEFLKNAEYSRQLCLLNGLEETASEFAAWIAGFDRFKTTIHPQAMEFKQSLL